jgi:transposase-like protein
MHVIPNSKASTLATFLAVTVEPSTTIVTDGFKAYRTATSGYAHEMDVVQGSEAYAHVLLPVVHRVIALPKRWIAATHQGGIQPQLLPAYLDEFVFRFNRRKSRAPGLIFYRLFQAMLSTAPTPWKVQEPRQASMRVPQEATAGSHHAPRLLALVQREPQ